MGLIAAEQVLAGTLPIVTTLTPNLPAGSLCYYQNGQFGAGKGLLLALTNTPLFKQMLVTNNGLQKISL